MLPLQGQASGGISGPAREHPREEGGIRVPQGLQKVSDEVSPLLQR